MFVGNILVVSILMAASHVNVTRVLRKTITSARTLMSVKNLRNVMRTLNVRTVLDRIIVQAKQVLKKLRKAVFKKQVIYIIST